MQHGVVAYECLGRAIRISPGYKGYLFIRNDLFLNYYKVAGLNRTRIWESAELQSGSQVMFEQPRESWIWWFTPWGLKACERAYRELISLNALYKRDSLDKGGRMEPWDVENALNALLWNGRGKYKCYRGYSQLFYIPAKYATAFEQMSAIFQKHQVYMEVAVPTVIRMLELRAESIPVAGVDITSLYGEERALSDTSLFWRHYDPHMSYVRPAVLKPGSRADADSEILEFLLSRLDGRPDCSLVESRVGSSGDTTTPPSLWKMGSDVRSFRCPRVRTISNLPCSLTRNIILTVWRTWLFIAYSDDRWLYYQFALRLGECTFWTWEWKGGCSGVMYYRVQLNPRAR